MPLHTHVHAPDDGKILLIGELNPDLILQGCHAFPCPGKEVLAENAVLTLGSATAICATGLARLGHEVWFASKVGADSRGRFCLEFLEQHHVNVSFVKQDPNLKTGLTVSVSSSRNRGLITYMGAIAEFSADDVDPSVLANFRHLHMSSYYMQVSLRPGFKTLLRRARQLGLTTSLDPQFDPDERWAPDLVETLRDVDMFLPNDVELRGITGNADPAEGLRSIRNGHTITVVKLGAAGCMTLSGNTAVSVPSLPVQPVDTTGAGDTFNAGMLHAWLGGNPIEECMRFAAACGALATLSPGGAGNQPTCEEVEARLHVQPVG